MHFFTRSVNCDSLKQQTDIFNRIDTSGSYSRDTMYDINTNRNKNRLYIILNELSRTELSEVTEAIENACNTLIPGFTCITAFKKGRIITNQDEDFIYLAQEIVFRYGVSKVVRVISQDSPIGQRQLNRLSINAEYPVEYAGSIEEAEKILDASEP